MTPQEQNNYLYKGITIPQIDIKHPSMTSLAGLEEGLVAELLE